MFPVALGTEQDLILQSIQLHVNKQISNVLPVCELGEANLILKYKYH